MLLVVIFGFELYVLLVEFGIFLQSHLLGHVVLLYGQVKHIFHIV